MYAIVREILHDGEEGNTYLSQGDSLGEIISDVLNGGCADVKVIDSIVDPVSIGNIEKWFAVDWKNRRKVQICVSQDAISLI